MHDVRVIIENSKFPALVLDLNVNPTWLWKHRAVKMKKVEKLQHS